jgi:hypothetical protein
MQQPLYCEIKDGYARYAPKIHVTLQQGVEMISRVIEFCRQERIAKLLLNTTAVTGVEPPSVPERFWFMRQWVEDAGGEVAIAFVVPPAFVDPQKFGIMVATNRGMVSDVFIAEADALKWLLGAKAVKAPQVLE